MSAAHAPYTFFSITRGAGLQKARRCAGRSASRVNGIFMWMRACIAHHAAAILIGALRRGIRFLVMDVSARLSGLIAQALHPATSALPRSIVGSSTVLSGRLRRAVRDLLHPCVRVAARLAFLPCALWSVRRRTSFTFGPHAAAGGVIFASGRRPKRDSGR